MTGSSVETILLTLGSCVIVAGLGVVGFIYSGLYDVAAVRPDNPMVAWAIHKTSDRSVAVRLGDVQVPPGLDRPDLVKAGGKLFGEHCVVCHGGPGLKPTAVALGLNPTPPNLFRAARDASMDETFWFIKNGVKMTGMPGFGKTLSDDQIWSLAAFLGVAPGMSPRDFEDRAGVLSPVANSKPTAS